MFIQRNRTIEGEADTCEQGEIKETGEGALAKKLKKKNTCHTHTVTTTHNQKGNKRERKTQKTESLDYSVCVWPQLQHFFPF